MKIAIIDIGWININPLMIKQGVFGGSETWLIQISKKFTESNIDVDVYLNTNFSCTLDGVNYRRESDFFNNSNTYNFIILNRFFKKDGVNYIEYIKSHHLSNHIYIQLHDLSLLDDCGVCGELNEIDCNLLNSDNVTIVTLNEWHRDNLLFQYPKLKKTICIPNGVDLSLFPIVNNEGRDNRILWSSCEERGLDILINDIYPIVKSSIPDFGIDISGYNDLSYYDNGDIKVLGKLSKTDLYKEMSKHKVWFYPGTFAETFCITMIENIMCGCQVVSPLTYGMHPTIGVNANEIGMNNNFEVSYNNAVVEAANKIIEILNNPTIPDIYTDIKDMISNKYNWCYSVDKYLSHYNNWKNSNKNSPKVLILSMSCNDLYFRGLLSAVKDTWAKPIIHNKYKNMQWFGYTSCDQHHPNPCIDWDERMIYVDCEDDLYHTYSKTKMAYELVKSSGIEIDYVIRTNTSTCVNPKLLYEKINIIDTSKDIMGCTAGFYIHHPDGSVNYEFSIIAGSFYGVPVKYFDDMMSKDEDYYWHKTDDVISSKILCDIYGDNIMDNVIKPNGDKGGNYDMEYPRYKELEPYDLMKLLEKDLVLKEQYEEGIFISDPNEINNNIVIRNRPLYDKNDRVEKGHEIEHMYELYNAMKL